jgi:hypothetical protein
MKSAISDERTWYRTIEEIFLKAEADPAAKEQS